MPEPPSLVPFTAPGIAATLATPSVAAGRVATRTLAGPLRFSSRDPAACSKVMAGQAGGAESIATRLAQTGAAAAGLTSRARVSTGAAVLGIGVVVSVVDAEPISGPALWMFTCAAFLSVVSAAEIRGVTLTARLALLFTLTACARHRASAVGTRPVAGAAFFLTDAGSVFARFLFRAAFAWWGTGFVTLPEARAAWFIRPVPA